MKRVIYQTGVDVLGFPIYMEHYLVFEIKRESKFCPKIKRWIKVYQRLIKQH